MKPSSYHFDQKSQWTNGVVVESRRKVPEIADYLEYSLSQLRPFKYIIEDGFDAKETYICLSKDLPDGLVADHKESFIQDVIRLCTLFSQRKQSTRMKIQLEIVKTNMCRLFHEDKYRQRLLCTYMGPGTEWLDHTNVNRDALGKGSNARIVKDSNQIHRANAFEVLILKGSHYGNGEPSVVHRSPPIEKEKKTRVLLKIDE